ncbi:hypothetical protein EJ08DRAFT_426182 [Tothia fuscella]|uniref:Uncharacterized protein n=1 Tax=Tothia fuscella TaxID=1048955 RepID=A0A9P4U2C0_9PEZI|nr:hypothetical protein EJ08DRAFT_426182 [Tothia fuscella]
MTDIKQLCTTSKQADFLNKLHDRACSLCKNDAAGLNYATSYLPNLANKCANVGIPIPQDILDKAKDATQCNSSPPPPAPVPCSAACLPPPNIASTRTVTATAVGPGATAVGPTQTVILPPVISSTTTIFNGDTGATIPPPTGGIVVVTTSTPTFSQGLSTTTYAPPPTGTRPVAFLGAGARVQVGWTPLLFLGGLLVF